MCSREPPARRRGCSLRTCQVEHNGQSALPRTPPTPTVTSGVQRQGTLTLRHPRKARRVANNNSPAGLALNLSKSNRFASTGRELGSTHASVVSFQASNSTQATLRSSLRALVLEGCRTTARGEEAARAANKMIASRGSPRSRYRDIRVEASLVAERSHEPILPSCRHDRAQIASAAARRQHPRAQFRFASQTKARDWLRLLSRPRKAPGPVRTWALQVLCAVSESNE